MSDRMHSRERRERSLPKGYQFGDAGVFQGFGYEVVEVDVLDQYDIRWPWRAPNENAAERNARYQDEYEAGPI